MSKIINLSDTDLKGTNLEDLSIEKIAKAMIVHRDEAFASSLQIAKYFGVPHNYLLKKIRAFKGFDKLIKLGKISQLKRTYRGNEFPYFELNAEVFTLTCMSFNDAKGQAFKWAFINAFKEISIQLLTERVRAETNQANAEWLKKRNEIKETRHELTDSIKEFCEMAQAQRGSQYPQGKCPYYSKITSLVYEVLNVQKPKGTQTLRNIYSGTTLEQIEYLEDYLVTLIQEHIQEDTKYHEAFDDIKEKMNERSHILRGAK